MLEMVQYANMMAQLIATARAARISINIACIYQFKTTTLCMFKLLFLVFK